MRGFLAGGLEEGLAGVWKKFSSSPALVGLAALLLVVAAFFAYNNFSTTAEFRVSVLSASSPVEGALVEVLSSDGRRLAQALTTREGVALFKQKLPAGGRVSVRVSKQGFLSADGAAASIAGVDLSKRKAASLELFSSQVEGGEFSQQISFEALDKITLQPVYGASLDATVAGKQVAAVTDAQGKVVVEAQKGDLVVVKVSAPNYFTASLAYTAIRSSEKILLSPRLSGSFSFAPGELPKISGSGEAKASDSVLEEVVSGGEASLFSMPQAIVEVRGGDGALVHSGRVAVVGESGQKIAEAQIVNGVALLSNLPLSQGFTLEVEGRGSEGGLVSVIDAATNNRLISSFINQGSASLATAASLDSLAVSVEARAGAPVSAGLVKAFDASTGALLSQSRLFNGLAVISAIAPNTRLTVSLEAQGFSAPAAQAIFGKTVSVTLAATPIALEQLRQTVFKAFASESEQPIGFELKIFSKPSSQGSSNPSPLALPVFEGSVSGEKTLQLPGGEYSAVFSSASRYSISIAFFQAGSAIEVTLPPSSAAGTASKCITPPGPSQRACTEEQLSPTNLFSLSTSVSDRLGQPIEGASVSLRDDGGRAIASQRSDSTGKALFSSVRGGSYLLAASSSGFSSSKGVVLASNLEETIVVELKATLFAGAKTISGQSLSASFVVEGTQLSCNGVKCSLTVDANSEFTIIASAPGHSSARATRRASPGQVLPLSFELVGADSGAQVVFRGARDALGRPAASLLAGQDYFLEFSFASPPADETIFALRLGDGASVAQEDYGLLDFQPPSGADYAAKSVSFTPHPACVDLNNNNAADGLFKWLQISFSARGAPLHKILSIPVRVKPSSSSRAMKLFYRLAGRTGSSVLRVPDDALLGAGLDSTAKAGCYADSLQAEIRIASSNSCSDATPENSCSRNTPLFCSKAGDGSLRLAASSSCCPGGTLFDSQQAACVSPTQVAQGACGDGTLENKCSAVNKGRLCSSGSLVPAVSCCQAGDVFEQGLCRPRSAACSVAGRVFHDGECLPTSPPFRCSDGREVLDAVACDCPAGSSLDLATRSCAGPGSPAIPKCTGGTGLGECSSNKPMQCVSLGGRLLLVENALACGCAGGKVSNGVECREAVVVPPVTGSTATPTPSSTATPAPDITPIPTVIAYLECSPPSSCVEEGTDDFCSATGKVVSSCLRCSPDCGGNPAFYCNTASDSCEERKCVDSFFQKTPLGACSQDNQPKRCEFVSGNPELVDFSSKCGCPSGFKPAPGGRQCIACVSASCEGEVEESCVDSQGNGYAAGQCMPESLSFTSSGGAEPVKKCLEGGSVVPLIGECGCPTGFRRNFDGTRCVPDPAASGVEGGGQPEGVLPADSTCPGCVAKDEIFFNQVTGKLATKSSKAEYEMVADAFFPADAFKLNVNSASSAFRISVQGITSTKGTAPCYSYELNSGVFSFRLNNDCPIIILGNKFFHSGSNEYVEGDEVTLTLRHETVPPQDLQLKAKLSLKSMESLRVQPVQLSGPDTPQLVFLINNKQTIFGSRQLRVAAKSIENNNVPGAGVKVLAWRGPGSLTVTEGEDVHEEVVGTLSYSRAPSYFQCAGETGPRIEACGGDPFCCAGGWCNGAAFSRMLSDFKAFSRNTAQATAFRRGLDSEGNGQPFAVIAGLAQSDRPFELFTAAQVIDGAPAILAGGGVSLSSFSDCSNSKRPGVFSIRASTKDGRKFGFNAVTAHLQKFDYVDGSCGDETLFKADARLARPDIKAQPLCDFLYGDCSCVQRTKHSVFATQRQHKDGKSSMDMPPLLMMLAPMLLDLLKGIGGELGGGQCGGQGGPGGAGGAGGGGCTNCANAEPLSELVLAPESVLQEKGSGQNIEIKKVVFEGVEESFVGEKSVFSSEPLSRVSLQGGGALGLACSLAKDLANAASPAVMSRFPAEEFKAQCEAANGGYTGARPQTDEACGGEVTSVGRTGGTVWWVDSTGAPPAHFTAIQVGICPFFPFPTCIAIGRFDMTKETNMGEILDELDRCEDEGHPPSPGTTNYNYCRPRVSQTIFKVNTEVLADIARAEQACVSQCSSTGCGCTGIPGCVARCQADAAQARARLQQKMNACRQAAESELQTGGQCEQLAKIIVESPGSTLPPGTPGNQRHAWATCYAWGTKSEGKCWTIVQEKFPFVHSGVEGDQIKKFSRHGILWPGISISPELDSAVGLMSPNFLPVLAAGRRGLPAGAQAEAPSEASFSPFDNSLSRQATPAQSLAFQQANDLASVVFKEDVQLVLPVPQIAGAVAQQGLAQAAQRAQAGRQAGMAAMRVASQVQQAIAAAPSFGASPFDGIGSGGLFIQDAQAPQVRSISKDDTIRIPDKPPTAAALIAIAQADKFKDLNGPFDQAHDSAQQGCGCVAGQSAGKQLLFSKAELAGGCGCTGDPNQEAKQPVAKGTGLGEQAGNFLPGACGAGGNCAGAGGMGGLGQALQGLMQALPQVLAAQAAQGQQEPQQDFGTAAFGAACSAGEECKSGFCVVDQIPSGSAAAGYCSAKCPAAAGSACPLISGVQTACCEDCSPKVCVKPLSAESQALNNALQNQQTLSGQRARAHSVLKVGEACNPAVLSTKPCPVNAQCRRVAGNTICSVQCSGAGAEGGRQCKEISGGALVECVATSAGGWCA